MAKYDNMVKDKKQTSKRMTEKAISIIREMLEENELISPTSLAKKTGFSRDFFYKNILVRAEREKAQRLQEGKAYTNNKKPVFDKAMDAELKLLRQKVEEQEDEIKKLRKVLEAETQRTIIEL